jgi:hypothetical protein
MLIGIASCKATERVSVVWSKPQERGDEGASRDRQADERQ